MSSRTYEPSPSTFAEDPDRYCEQGLHPLIIGDTVKDGRYRIVHKLGSGSYATVWLVRDTVAEKYVSLKILSAASSVELKELHILQRIRDSQVTHKGRDFVIQLLDNFFIDGPNGTHLCLVAAVAGERLARKPGLPHGDLDWSCTVGLQMAQALGFLHVLGIAHADCYTSNILSKLLPFDDWSEDDIYTCLGQPNKHHVRRLDGEPRDHNAPEYTVDPGDVAALEARCQTNEVILIDVGSGFFHDEKPPHIFTPAPHAAPEILFRGELTAAVDQWAFGCLLYELCAGRPLVKLLFGWNNDAMKDQVAMLGKPCDALWQNWQGRDKYFHPDGTPKEAQGRRLKVQPLSLEQRVRNLQKPLSEWDYGTGETTPLPPDFQNLYELLNGVIRYDAQARLSFEEIQAHPFFAAVDT